MNKKITIYNFLIKCPACGKKIDKSSRKGIRQGECAFCGKIYKQK